jgi:Concanavalin A-like lectin/glucanases superfamily/PEP-CTERM motif
MNMMKSICAFSMVMLIGTAAQGATIFGATYDSSKTADIAAGNPAPTVAGTSTINNASSKFGAGSLDTSTSTSGNNGTKYATASNFNPLAGTVDLWMQLPNGYDGTRQDLFSIFAGGFTGDFSLYINPATQRLLTVVDVNGANQWQQGGFANAFNVLGDTNWHHIAWEWDTNAGFATLFVDGVPENFGVIGSVSFAGGTLGAEMEIGSRQGGFDAFKGNIDDVRISSTAIYGQVGFTPPTQSTVPEPATIGLLGIGVLMLARRR